MTEHRCRRSPCPQCERGTMELHYQPPEAPEDKVTIAYPDLSEAIPDAGTLQKRVDEVAKIMGRRATSIALSATTPQELWNWCRLAGQLWPDADVTVEPGLIEGRLRVVVFRRSQL